jgi:hypothetical protein
MWADYVFSVFLRIRLVFYSATLMDPLIIDTAVATSQPPPTPSG